MTLSEKERATMHLQKVKLSATTAMKPEVLMVWARELLLELQVTRGVTDMSSRFLELLVRTLSAASFTPADAHLAEQWLRRGTWDSFRKRGALSASDFFPTLENISSLGSLSDIVQAAAHKILHEIHGRDYLHRTQVMMMVSEARVQARTEALREVQQNSEEYVTALMQKKRELDKLNDAIEHLAERNRRLKIIVSRRKKSDLVKARWTRVRLSAQKLCSRACRDDASGDGQCRERASALPCVNIACPTLEAIADD